MDLEEYRKQINDIDAQLTELFGRRMRICREIAVYKAENGLPVADKTREREIMEAAAKRSDPDIGKYTRMFMTGLVETSKAYQREVIAGKTENF
ncbi:MAG: chorismate mutase [Clostridia bacterium]|nr:chorismate mutase [Clostridia bacterium]